MQDPKTNAPKQNERLRNPIRKYSPVIIPPPGLDSSSRSAQYIKWTMRKIGSANTPIVIVSDIVINRI